jgi:hypothetical protein
MIVLLQLETPFEATSPSWVIVTGPPQLSEAVTEPMFGGGTWEKHCTLTGPGHVMDVELVRVMICVQVAVKPWESMAVQVRVMIAPAQFEPVIMSV